MKSCILGGLGGLPQPRRTATIVVLQGRCDTFIKVPAPGGAQVHTGAIRLVGDLSQPLRVLGVGATQRISFQSHLARQLLTIDFGGLD